MDWIIKSSGYQKRKHFFIIWTPQFCSALQFFFLPSMPNWTGVFHESNTSLTRGERNFEKAAKKFQRLTSVFLYTLNIMDIKIIFCFFAFFVNFGQSQHIPRCKGKLTISALDLSTRSVINVIQVKRSELRMMENRLNRFRRKSAKNSLFFTKVEGNCCWQVFSR